MTETTALPKDPLTLARTIKRHLDIEENRRYIRALKFQLAHAYLNGIRKFDATVSGRKLFTFNVDSEGKLPMTLPELMLHVNKVSGLMRSMDMWPNVGRRGDSLSITRDGGFTQAALDSVISDTQLDTTCAQASHIMALHGTVGLAGNVEDIAGIGLIGDLEVIHPFELYPFPAVGFDYTKLRGKIRTRRVSLPFIKKTWPGKVTKDNLLKLNAMKRKFVTKPADPSASMTYDGTGGGVTNNGAKDEYVEVFIWELWVDGPLDTCSRYAAGSGDVIFEDVDYADKGVICYPGVTVKTFWDTGDFYGAGLYEGVYTMVREFERNVQSLLTNVRDIDRNQILVLPHGTLDEKTSFRETGKGLKVLMYKPEASFLGQQAPNAMTVPVVNAGEVPGRTAAYMHDLIKGSVPIRDILSEKGRVDSYSGLQYLEEEAQRSSVVPISNFRNLFSETYRGIAYKLMQHLVTAPTRLPLKRLDLSLAGAVIDFKNYSVSLNVNRMPDLSRLSMGVKEQSPRSKSVRKQEATANLEKQLISRTEYILLALKEGWDPAFWIEGERGAYETEVYMLLRLFNDGEQPGEAEWMLPNAENVEISSAVCKAFMQSPVFRMASADVVDAINLHYNTLLTYQGKMLPQDVPDPYEATLTAPDQPSTVS